MVGDAMMSRPHIMFSHGISINSSLSKAVESRLVGRADQKLWKKRKKTNSAEHDGLAPELRSFIHEGMGSNENYSGRGSFRHGLDSMRVEVSASDLCYQYGILLSRLSMLRFRDLDSISNLSSEVGM